MRVEPTLEDTCAWFQCSDETLNDFLKKNFNMTFLDFRKAHAVQSRMGIKRKMIEKALAGDNQMLIWLSKNMLGMSDKVETKNETKVEVTEVTYQADFGMTDLNKNKPNG